MKSSTSNLLPAQPKKSSRSFFGQVTGQGMDSEHMDPTFFGPAPFIQAKLTIGAPDDPYEREANAVAEQVVQRMSAPASEMEEKEQIQPKIQRLPLTVQRKCAACEEEEKVQKKEEDKPEEMEGPIQRKPIFESNGDEEPPPGVQPAGPMVQRKCAACEQEEQGAVQRKPSGGGEMTASADVASRISHSKGGGSPLPESVQSAMGGALGADLSGVRVHTDSRAVQLNRDLGAQAFTHGSDVYFGAGKFQPGTGDGDRLLAHELVHVGQQGGGIRREPRDEPNPSQGSSVASVGSLTISSILSRLSQIGFRSAGPNAIGIISFPSASLTHMSIPQNLETYGHTAIYVRINGRIVFTRGFSVANEMDIFRQATSGSLFQRLSTQWSRIWGRAPIDVPSAITNDAAMWGHTGSRTVEWPVSETMARTVAGSTPQVGPATGSTPGRYTLPVQPGCTGSNCVYWAIRQMIERHLGGNVGRAGEGSIVDSPGRFANQGRLTQFLRSLISGRSTMEPLPNASGPGVASEMPLLSRLGIWGGRALKVAGPALEFWSNLRQNIPMEQNLARTGTVGLGTLALPQLFSGNRILGMQGGGRGAGLADLAVNLTNLGVHLMGGPEWLTSVTQTGAELTPSNTMFAGAKGLADIIYSGITQGTSGLESVHRNMVQGQSGGVMQGYSMIGDVLSGQMPDIDLQAAERGDYGIFPQSGMYWGDVLSGDRSLTSDLGEIWDYIWD